MTTAYSSGTYRIGLCGPQVWVSQTGFGYRMPNATPKPYERAPNRMTMVERRIERRIELRIERRIERRIE